MIERLLATAESVATGWRAEAVKRQQVWAEDPVAGCLAFCAKELESQVAELRRDTVTMTVKEYAVMRGKSEQTVRAWIRRGRLDAVKGPHGYEIPATARPKLRLHRPTVAA